MTLTSFCRRTKDNPPAVSQCRSTSSDAPTRKREGRGRVVHPLVPAAEPSSSQGPEYDVPTNLIVWTLLGVLIIFLARRFGL